MTASFWGVNLKGMEGLLSGVFRCCSSHKKKKKGQPGFFEMTSFFSPLAFFFTSVPLFEGKGKKGESTYDHERVARS